MNYRERLMSELVDMHHEQTQDRTALSSCCLCKTLTHRKLCLL